MSGATVDGSVVPFEKRYILVRKRMSWQESFGDDWLLLLLALSVSVRVGVGLAVVAAVGNGVRCC